jgi:4-amino-4-deoxy-L-arabinose transferase-like glycosyltransferase
VEREWREAADMKPAMVWLVVVLAVAAVLRFIHLGHGIPFQVGVDEPQIMSRVVRMMKTGNFDPDFFDYPGMIFHLHLVVACLRFLVGAMTREFASLAVVGQDNFFLWGRALTASFGVATVFLVHQIGMRWGARHALLAAGLMAVMPMHVRESHFVLTDVPTTFFTALTLLLTLVAHERASVGAFAWAGVAAGLAMGTKYPAGLAVIMPVIAASMTLHAKPSRLACMVASLIACVVAFLVVAPYTLLDLPGFLNGFAHLMTAVQPRGTDYEPAAITYLKHLLRNLGWPALILMFSGLLLGIVRAVKGPGRVRWTLVVTFPSLFFYLLSGHGLVYGRYLLPAIPFVCILAATAVISGVSLLRRFDIPRAPRTALIVALTVAAVLPPTVRALGFVRMIGQQSTQALAYEWIGRHVPAGARIIVERYEIQLPAGQYKADYVARLTDREYDHYKKDGVNYLLSTSQVSASLLANPEANRDAYQRYMTMLTMGREAARFTPSANVPGPELVLIEIR